MRGLFSVGRKDYGSINSWREHKTLLVQHINESKCELIAIVPGIAETSFANTGYPVFKYYINTSAQVVIINRKELRGKFKALLKFAQESGQQVGLKLEDLDIQYFVENFLPKGDGFNEIKDQVVKLIDEVKKELTSFRSKCCIL